MDIKEFINDWLLLSNAYDIEAYLNKWHEEAVLDDPSVGKIFKGHSGIRKYFEDYFIGYKTHTKLISIDIISEEEANIEVEFTGDFPGNKINGIFEFTFSEGKIKKAIADLV